MRFFEKHPMAMIVIGIIGISLSAIFVKYSSAPSSVTAAYRLLWTVLLMTPVVLGKKSYRKELRHTDRRTVWLCAVSGIFLALHFTFWFESLNHTTVASSTAIVCTEVIWVALGFTIFMKGFLSRTAVISIAVTLAGSLLIAFSDSSGAHGSLYGDMLALAAAMFVAVYTLIGRIARTEMSTVSYTYIVYGFCSLSLLLILLVQRTSLFGHGKSPAVVGLLLSIFSTLLGHSIFSWCLKFFSPAFVSASKLCEPVVASVFAVFLFQELPAALQILGGLVTIGGVLLYSRAEASEAKTPAGAD